MSNNYSFNAINVFSRWQIIKTLNFKNLHQSYHIIIKNHHSFPKILNFKSHYYYDKKKNKTKCDSCHIFGIL